MSGISSKTSSSSGSTGLNAGDGVTINNSIISLTPLQSKNYVIISDSNGKLVASTISTSTLGFLDATSSIQTQFSSLSSSITSINTSIGGLTTTIGTKLNLTGGALTGSLTIPSGSFLYSNAISTTTGSIAITAASPGNIAMYAPAGALYFNTSSTTRLQITSSGAFVLDYDTFTPVTGATVTLTKSITLINPAAAIAALNIVLPSAVDGQRVTVSNTQSITATTFTGTFVNGSTPPASVFSNAGVALNLMYTTKGITGWINIG
jgi:hypothetical protein